MSNPIQQELRLKHRKARAALSKDQQKIAAKNLCIKLLELPEYATAQKIGVYFAVRGEISLDPFIDAALEDSKMVYLPNLDKVDLRFSEYFHGQKMRINRFNLPEPDILEKDMLQPRDLNLILAPLVVFDSQCNRIGMGGGYYDRSFAFKKIDPAAKPYLFGVAHEIQRVELIEPESWDVTLQKIITDKYIYNCKNSAKITLTPAV